MMRTTSSNCLSFLRHGHKLKIVLDWYEKGDDSDTVPLATIRRPRTRVSLGRLLSSRAGLRFAWQFNYRIVEQILDGNPLGKSTNLLLPL
jgi:hypothetical protein